jgi:hypothetical protein
LKTRERIQDEDYRIQDKGREEGMQDSASTIQDRALILHLESCILRSSILHPSNEKAAVVSGCLVDFWLPGTDSNRRPSGYKYPDISTRLGLSHHPSLTSGLRVSGASPAEPLAGYEPKL